MYTADGAGSRRPVAVSLERPREGVLHAPRSACRGTRRCAAGRRRRPGRCRAARSRTGAGSSRGSCRTPAAVSATELLMTCSTSAVAVCCSSASLVSLNRRAFWIAITAWSAKVCSSALLLVVERRAAPRGRPGSSRCPALPQHRRDRHRVGLADLHARSRRSAVGHVGVVAARRRTCTSRRSRIACSVTVPASGTGKIAAHALDRARRRAADARQRAAAPGRRPGRCISWSPANRRSQLARILSNTGAVSATELLITCSTSAVAVCCSSASLVSLNRRAFSIAITAWSAKVCSRAISARRERPDPVAQQRDHADRLALAQHRHRQHRAEAAPRLAARARRGTRSSMQRNDVARRGSSRRSRNARPATERAVASAARADRVGRRVGAVVAVIVQQLAVDAQPDAAAFAPGTAARRARRRRRTPAARRSASALMTCSISAVAVCRSSASLVSLNRRTFSIAITAWSAKVCEQVDLVLGERRRARRAVTAIAPTTSPLAQHRHGQHGAVAGRAGELVAASGSSASLRARRRC